MVSPVIFKESAARFFSTPAQCFIDFWRRKHQNVLNSKNMAQFGEDRHNPAQRGVAAIH
jgi:hypothetical protein